jgi:hypothetical protein
MDEDRENRELPVAHHRVDIYHLAYSGGGHYQSRCACGWQSELAVQGSSAWQLARELHPEGCRM